MRRKQLISAIILLLSVGLPVLLSAGSLTYQARLQDPFGEDIDGPVTVGFRIYDTLTGSTVLWGETQALVAEKGIVTVDLGKVNPLPGNLFENDGLYLGVTVAGDSEMNPRRRLVGAWKAVSTTKASGKAIQAGGATLTVSGTSEGSVAITFPEAFSAPPVVMVGAPHDPVGSVRFIHTRVAELTSTGAMLHFTSLDGSSASGSTDFDWIAVGE